MRSIRLLLFSYLTAVLGWSQPYIISTIAGTERLLDGNPAINVPLRDPRSIKFDVAGSFYVADTGDHRIRKVNQSGVIGTIAGTGLPGFGGDRGKATAAQLNSPTSLAFDGNGNLYVADRDNFRVRRISSDGTINTVAGNGTPGYSGDKGPATSAQIRPYAVATDNKGNLYIADAFNYVIRKVDVGGTITTIAGAGTPGYAGDNGPALLAQIDFVIDLAVGPDGSLYLADLFNSRVRKIDPSGMLTTVAGTDFGFIADGVPATLAVMLPQGVAVDTFGNIYISDFNRDVVRKVDVGTGLIHTVAGDGTTGFGGDNGTAVKAQLNSPFGLALDSTGLYFADQGNQRIRRITADVISTVAGTSIRDGGPATSAFLNLPAGIAVDGANNIVVADHGNAVARRFSVGGNINTFGQLQAPPTGVATDQAGNFFVTDDEPRILKITPAGVTSIVAGNGHAGYSGDNGPAISAMISEPTGVAVDISGNVYFTDYHNNRIRKVAASTGTITTIAGNGTLFFGGDDGPALAAGIDPQDIAIDSRSNIYVADRLNSRIRKIGPDGTITTVAGTGFPGYSGDGGLATAAMLTFPTGVAVDNAGNLYITDPVNGVLRRVTASGLITTIAGTGVSRPATGDGGPALAAQVNPARVAVDIAGNVYVTDSLNDRVRKLAPLVVTATAMTILAGNNQNGTVGTKLANPIVVRIADATKAAVPGVIVNFAVTPAGAATVNPSQAITLPDGSASVIVTLGSIPGPITITATASGVTSVAFTATAAAAVSPTAPHISPGGVVGAGLSTPPVTGIVPNAIVSIFGTKFAPDGTARQVGGDDLVNGKLPTNLAGVCVLFGTQPAPIFAVFPGQLNVQVPAAAPGTTGVRVIAKCDMPQPETSDAEPVTIVPTAPEFFYFVHNANGRNPIATINAITGGYIGAAGLVAGTLFTPAKPGDILSLFATALGATNPSFAPGELPGVAAQVTAPFSVSIGGVTLAASDILYVGVTQNAGLYQVNLRVPDAVPDGDQAVILTVGGVSTPVGGFLTVRR